MDGARKKTQPTLTKANIVTILNKRGILNFSPIALVIIEGTNSAAW